MVDIHIFFTWTPHLLNLHKPYYRTDAEISRDKNTLETMTQVCHRGVGGHLHGSWNWFPIETVRFGDWDNCGSWGRPQQSAASAFLKESVVSHRFWLNVCSFGEFWRFYWNFIAVTRIWIAWQLARLICMYMLGVDSALCLVKKIWEIQSYFCFFRFIDATFGWIKILFCRRLYKILHLFLIIYLKRINLWK